MRGWRAVASVLATLGLLLPLAGCGKYGRPVRKSSSLAAPEPAYFHEIHEIHEIDHYGLRARERAAT